jgi:hypothetical protein
LELGLGFVGKSFEPWDTEVHLYIVCLNSIGQKKFSGWTHHHRFLIQSSWYSQIFLGGVSIGFFISWGVQLIDLSTFQVVQRLTVYHLLYPVNVLRIWNLRVQQFNYFWCKSEVHRIILCESDRTCVFFFYTFYWSKCREGREEEGMSTMMDKGR